jgi:hypothetical protein
MSAQPEMWRVSTIEGIFETDLETLKQWIVEGCVLPTDKVSKGTLSWIDAGLVPKLKRAFEGVIDPPPASSSEPEVATSQGGWQVPPNETQAPFEPDHANPYSNDGPVVACHNHPGVEPKYVCRMCATTLCAECPRFVGTSKIAVCPLCGDLCHSYTEIKTKSARAEFQSSGFGFGDFSTAMRYPWKHKVALISGAALYGLLLLTGLRGSLVAWMIMFGCISHVISQVAWGRLDRSFMPDFSQFSFLEDLVQPIFLGLGITLVSWGPVIVLVLAVVFGVVSSGPPSTLGPTGQLHAAEHVGPTEEDLSVLMDPDADPKKVEEANRKLNQLRPGAQIAREAERSKSEQDDPLGMLRQLLPYLGAGIFFVFLLGVGLLWALFYYPMALTVAGYTQSFWSVVNPLVGLDTIRRMGATYFAAFGMVILIQFIGAIIGGIVTVVTSPFSLPFMGNLPAAFLNGSITFYLNLVIACLLGLSLYKCADRLGINVD